MSYGAPVVDFRTRLPATPLRAWQQDALQAWDNNGRRGIVAAATGTGKTLFALHAISRFWSDNARVVVVVPKQVLQDQWISLFRTSMSLGPKVLGTIGGTKHFNLNHRVVVAVIDSARQRLTDPVGHWREQGDCVLLIVDECHWAGSETSASLFAAGFDATLGLSATPERGDDGFDELLVPQLGEVVFRYPLREALDDGLLSPLTLHNVYFELSASERREHARLDDQIRSLRGALDEMLPDGPGWDARLATAAGSSSEATRLQSLLQQRRRLVSRSSERTVAFQRILEAQSLEQRRTLIFCESITQAEDLALRLEERTIAHELEHSRLSKERRHTALRRFAAGAIDTLICVRALDEGIDVPDADQALIVSGTTNPRQRIQRIGRVARPSPVPARVISLLARGTTEELVVGQHDTELVGQSRVRHLPIERVTDVCPW